MWKADYQLIKLLFRSSTPKGKRKQREYSDRDDNGGGKIRLDQKRGNTYQAQVPNLIDMNNPENVEKKKEERGAFTDRIFLESVTEAGQGDGGKV